MNRTPERTGRRDATAIYAARVTHRFELSSAACMRGAPRAKAVA